MPGSGMQWTEGGGKLQEEEQPHRRQLLQRQLLQGLPSDDALPRTNDADHSDQGPE